MTFHGWAKNMNNKRLQYFNTGILFGKILNFKVLAFYAIALIFGIPAGAGP